jgi:hypothetical protein
VIGPDDRDDYEEDEGEGEEESGGDTDEDDDVRYVDLSGVEARFSEDGSDEEDAMGSVLSCVF